MQGRGRETPKASGVPAAAALLSASVLLSRALGYARDAVLANRVGVSPEADAYNAAFQIPDMLNYFLAGGALSIAFLPFYARLRTADRDEAAERFFATVLGTLGVLALASVGLLWWQSEPLVELWFGKFEPATRDLTVRMTRIVLPAQFFFVVGGIVQATLLARGRFWAQALAPLVYNAGIIAGGLFLAPRIGVEGFSWGALAGAALGPFLIPLLDARGRVPIRVRVAPLDPELRRYLVVAAPLMLGVTLLTVDEWYDRVFGARLGEGAVALLGYARRLMQLPVSVVGQALGAAVLPALAYLWSQGRREELDRVLEQTLRAGLALAVLAAAATLAFALPLIEFLYHHGRFTAADVEQATPLLRLFALAVPAWVAQQILVRAFYARQDTWRPMILGSVVALGMLPLYWLLGQRLDVAGLAIAGVVGMSVNALATWMLARRLHGAPRGGVLLASLARAGAIAVPAGYAGHALLVGRTGQGGALLDLLFGGLAFAAVAACGVALLGDPPLRAALRRAIDPRLRRGRGA